MTRHGPRYGEPGIEQQVWDLAEIIHGKDKQLVRRDPMGKIIRRESYGKEVETGGWTIDHIIPKRRGGSDYLNNLQAYNIPGSHMNGSSCVKPSRYNPHWALPPAALHY